MRIFACLHNLIQDIEPSVPAEFLTPVTPVERLRAVVALKYVSRYGLYQYWLAIGNPFFKPADHPALPLPPHVLLSLDPLA